MKKIHSVYKSVRLLMIVLGIPLILMELIKPELLDFSNLLGNTYIFGTRTDHFCQIIVVGSELGERILRLKETRFQYILRMVPVFKRIRL